MPVPLPRIGSANGGADFGGKWGLGLGYVPVQEETSSPPASRSCWRKVATTCCPGLRSLYRELRLVWSPGLCGIRVTPVSSTALDLNLVCHSHPLPQQSCIAVSLDKQAISRWPMLDHIW